MKKRISIILFGIITAVVLLNSCVGRDNSLKEETSDSNLPVLKIGSASFAPYFYMGEDGEYTGVDKEIAEEACTRMGYQPEFVTFTWGEQDEMLKEKKIDCIWSCFSIQGREEKYSWSEPYLKIRDMVVVPADSEIESLQDLEGKKIAVRVGTKIQDYFLKDATEGTPKPEQISTFITMQDVFAAFGKGYTDAVAGPEAGLKNFTKNNENLYRYLPEPLFLAKIGVAFEKGQNEEVINLLNQELDEMKQDGTIAQIAKKYGLNKAEYREDGAGDEG